MLENKMMVMRALRTDGLLTSLILRPWHWWRNWRWKINEHRKPVWKSQSRRIIAVWWVLRMCGVMD